MTEVLAADRGVPPVPPTVKGATLRKVGRYALLCLASFIVLYAGVPFAYLQSYRIAADDFSFGDRPGKTIGIDQFIGEADMLGRGHGARFIGAFTRHLLAQGAPRVVIDPDPENLAAIRAYEKAGFTALDIRETGDGPALIMIQEPV